jgi:hypothetical protein
MITRPMEDRDVLAARSCLLAALRLSGGTNAEGYIKRAMRHLGEDIA